MIFNDLFVERKQDCRTQFNIKIYFFLIVSLAIHFMIHILRFKAKAERYNGLLIMKVQQLKLK